MIIINDIVTCDMFSIDMRKGDCFRDFYASKCQNPLVGNVTKAQCCCSTGAGWGYPCQVCPDDQSGKLVRDCFDLIQDI